MEKTPATSFSVRRFFRKGALFLFSTLIAPRSLSEDDRRHEFILNILLLCSLSLTLVAFTVIVLDSVRLGSDYTGVPWWAVSAILVVFALLLFASRRGRFTTSAHVLIALYLIPAIYMTLVWGMDLPQGLLIYSLLISMSSVLLGTRFSLAFTLLLAFFLSSLALLYNHNIWTPSQAWRSHPFVALDGVVYAVTFAAIAAVSWLSNREIEKSLVRARTSEAALKTERDNLEVTVEKRTSELRQAQAEKMSQLQRFVEFGRLASGLFHDLANPLTAVALNLESLHQEKTPPAAGRAKEHLEQALKTTKGLENFLAAARKQLQSQEVHVDFDVAHEVQQVIDVLSHKSKRAGVEIQTKLGRRLTLFGNPLKFHQVVANLISNAIDAYDGLAKSKKRLPIDISLHKQGATVCLVVQDHGCGMTTDIQKRVFEPFFTTKDLDRGMGIGLSSARNIVEKDFHGSLSFTSQPERGSTFTICIPPGNRSAAS